MKVFAIDPGNTESAFVVLDEGRIAAHAKVPNAQMLSAVQAAAMRVEPSDRIDACVIEMVASYGMAVGREIFETVYWIGRFAERWEANRLGGIAHRLFRLDVKLHLCHTARAKDGNIRQALVDRFGDKGTKAQPGPTYGIRADEWAALALAVTFSDKHMLDAAPDATPEQLARWKAGA